MKKYRLLPLAAAVLFSVIACEREQAEIQIIPSDDQAKVYASFSASGEDTKTILDFSDETSNVKWEDTDCVAVFDGTAKNEFTVKAGTNTGAEAVFEGMVTDGATMLYAVYPSSAAESLNSGVLRLTVPAEQHIASGACADYSALVSVGSAERNQPVTFKQVCGLMKITIASADVQEIRLVGKNLAGKADVAASGELQSVADPSDEIVLTHEEGLFPIGTFYAAVLPGTSPAGSFSIKLVKIGRTGVKTAASAVTFQRRKGIDAGPLNDLKYSIEIHNMAELFSWNATRGTDEINDVVIAADIDMEMEPWVPKDFKGTFDGRGHKLYNLNVQRSSNACFFNTVTGTVKDVTFGSSNGSSYDGSSAIIQDNPEDDGENWRYAGLFTRLGTNTELTNVVSYVPVTVAVTSKSKTRVGGLVAVVAGTSENVSLKNCENHGEVSILADAPAAAGAASGIIGWSDTKISCSNVTNYGDITIKNSFVSYAAGILPCDNYGCTFDTCANNGNISISGSGARGMCVGGIVGDATDSNVKSCSNSGKIEISIDGEMKVGGIIGRAYLGCTVKDCINSSTGVIVSNAEGATKRTFLGGIVGNSPAANNTELTIENSKNYASLSTENAQVASVSGIA
ncbi:MAG: hypothetical protein IKH11_05770, partial [Bacteroidales bacterium]|nr:hypothetical protein [Bacteroidales bacterium]